VETLDSGSMLLNIGEQMVLGKRKLWNCADYGSYTETELMQMLTLYDDISNFYTLHIKMMNIFTMGRKSRSISYNFPEFHVTVETQERGSDLEHLCKNNITPLKKLFIWGGRTTK
jgi:hypothetical protein